MEKEKQLELIEKYLRYTNVREGLSKKEAEVEAILDNASFKTQLRIFTILMSASTSEDFSGIFHKSLLSAMTKELKMDPESKSIAPDWFFEVLEGNLDIPHKLNENFRIHVLRIYKELLECENKV